MNKIVIDRATYKRIKSMNKEQMEDFLVKYAAELIADTPTIDLDFIREDISHVRGIGPERLEIIMQIIKERIGGHENDS
jgi:hypothetical protein